MIDNLRLPISKMSKGTSHNYRLGDPHGLKLKKDYNDLAQAMSLSYQTQINDLQEQLDYFLHEMVNYIKQTEFELHDFSNNKKAFYKTHIMPGLYHKIMFVLNREQEEIER